MRGRNRYKQSTRRIGGFALGLALVVAMNASVGSAQEAGDAAAAPANEKRVRLAMLPFVVHSNERPEYLRQGLADMLMARFIQHDVLQVIEIEDAEQATTQLDEAIKSARAIDAEFVLFGSFTRFGQGASLDVQTAAVESGPDGETMREIFVHSGSIGDVIPDLDELVGKVTRFAVSDYVAAPAAPGGDGEAPATAGATLSELQQRIEALEAEMAELRTTQGGQ